MNCGFSVGNWFNAWWRVWSVFRSKTSSVHQPGHHSAGVKNSALEPRLHLRRVGIDDRAIRK